MMELILKNDDVIHVLQSIKEANGLYTEAKEHEIKTFSLSQAPVCTLVMCCDSRAHSTSFTANPENNFFRTHWVWCC